MTKLFPPTGCKTTGFVFATILLVNVSVAQNFMEPTHTNPQLATYVSRSESPQKAKAASPGTLVQVMAPESQNLSEVMQRIGYPTAAREARIQGTVVLAVLVNAEGKVVRSAVVSSPHQLLSVAVQERAGDLKFIPGAKNGLPATMWVQVPLRFRLF